MKIWVEKLNLSVNFYSVCFLSIVKIKKLSARDLQSPLFSLELLEGRVPKEILKMRIYPHLLLTHPPTPKCGKKQKKHVVFGLFSSFGTKISFLKFLHLETHRCHPLEPSTVTNNWHTPLPPPTMMSSAVADAGGGWHQWWLAVMSGNSGCQRCWWVVLVGRDVCWWQERCWVAIADVGIGCCLTQCLAWPPLKREKKLV